MLEIIFASNIHMSTLSLKTFFIIISTESPPASTISESGKTNYVKMFETESRSRTRLLYFCYISRGKSGDTMLERNSAVIHGPILWPARRLVLSLLNHDRVPDHPVCFILYR